MTPAEFRQLALSFPETEERSHMDHPDFRVKGKIFSTLGPNEEWGMLKLTPDEQAAVLKTCPDAFQPASGAWGKGGATIVTLELVERDDVYGPLVSAWKNTAPKKLVEQWEEA